MIQPLQTFKSAATTDVVIPPLPARRPSLVPSADVELEPNSATSPLRLRYLQPAEYPAWDELVEASPEGSVFCRSWWLNAVTNARVLGCFSGDDLVAGIPLFWERRLGLTACTMPKLTYTWGVVMRPPRQGKRVAAVARQTAILSAFAQKLSRCRLFFQTFHPTLVNWLPFYWAGFRQTTRFSYVIDDLTDLSRIWDNLSRSTRGHIRNAEKAGLEIVPCSASQVYQCELQSYQRGGTRPPHTESLLTAIYDAARIHDSGACFAAVDPHGNVHSASMLVWDRERTYLLVGGLDPVHKNSGAPSLLIWRAMHFASQRSRMFDFVGSMKPGIERFNRHFGAKQVPYNFIMRVSPFMELGLRLVGKL